jgi:hypothetical protein
MEKKYSSWSMKMNTYFKSIGFGIWESITIGYANEARKESSENNTREIDFILSGLSDFETIKVMKCTSAKQIWDKLQNINEDLSIEERSGDCSSCESEKEGAQFVRKIKGGPRKYKVKLPFKFFNCGENGHFDAKCPY